MEGLKPLDIVIYIINIIVLFVLLRALVYNPVRKFMSERSARIQAELDAANAVKEEAERITANNAALLEQSKGEADCILRECTTRSNKIAENIIENARKEAVLILDKARRDAESERIHAVRQMRGEIIDIALEMAGRIVGHGITEEDNRAIIDEFFTKVG